MDIINASVFPYRSVVLPDGKEVWGKFPQFPDLSAAHTFDGPCSRLLLTSAGDIVPVRVGTVTYHPVSGKFIYSAVLLQGSEFRIYYQIQSDSDPLGQKWINVSNTSDTAVDAVAVLNGQHDVPYKKTVQVVDAFEDPPCGITVASISVRIGPNMTALYVYEDQIPKMFGAHGKTVTERVK